MIFSLERALSGGTKLTLELANKLGKPVLRIYDTREERGSNPDSFFLEIQALSDFVCSNKIEIPNVTGPRESKEPGVYDWTLKMFRLFLPCWLGKWNLVPGDSWQPAIEEALRPMRHLRSILWPTGPRSLAQ